MQFKQSVIFEKAPGKHCLGKLLNRNTEVFDPCHPFFYQSFVGLKPFQLAQDSFLKLVNPDPSSAFIMEIGEEQTEEP